MHELSTSQRSVRSDLGHHEPTNDLVRGVDAIVHSGEVDHEASVSDRLDAATRCTYNLLWAAAEEGVPRVIFLSSLRVLNKYGEDLAVNERWRPVPTTDTDVLCYHLGEYVCREFARERKLDVVCLRLGEMVWDTGQARDVPSSGLFLDDAVHAVENALTAEISMHPTGARPSWSVFHIQSALPNARYLTEAAKEKLGYQPRGRK
jgi:nucleoside-diphosphate-sugar epimerase